VGILISNNLRPRAHINSIVAKAHKRAFMIQRVFVSRNIDLFVRAYLVYVRPLVEYNSVVWAPDTIQDIETAEKLWRRFTKNLPGLRNSPIRRGYDVYIYPVGIKAFACCGVVKYFLASLR